MYNVAEAQTADHDNEFDIHVTATRFAVPHRKSKMLAGALFAYASRDGMHDTVRHASHQIDPHQLRMEVSQFVPTEGLRVLQGTGVRDELVFAVPAVLQQAPTAIGHYRLLLGLTTAEFYSATSGIAEFSVMEERGAVPPALREDLPSLCRAINVGIAQMLAPRGLHSTIPSDPLARWKRSDSTAPPEGYGDLSELALSRDHERTSARAARRALGDWPGREVGVTERELDVLRMITEGLSNQEIADRSFLSINSVKSYIRAAYRKIDVSSRSKAVLWGVQNGLMEQEPVESDS
ncbi:regulatory LuxR family protein [Branchiibius hedensis]|uniref:Regulatory protein, luxR family n=1 Tax=Branchiibius hedensis TaxID=672460 RepID=A0A2Y8ZUM7_9MICO|nr:XcyI family restriction endonuclease [Branchiibius hedensis]PWJ26923.1 regulatory LuxR family protein [Branchiibius hedensis]SSA35734.1 regulatory protein, luxR family [Branchiibius hedensis]